MLGTYWVCVIISFFIFLDTWENEYNYSEVQQKSWNKPTYSQLIGIQFIIAGFVKQIYSDYFALLVLSLL